jgi:hypothetical protein
MRTRDRVLVLLLRFFGLGSLLALGAVFLQLSWMVSTHRWLGLGEMPTAPIVAYLARWLSAFYAFFGVWCLALTADLERYRPLVRFLGIGLAVMGILATGIDLLAPMPWWWTAQEGPACLALGVLICYLARSPHRPEGDARQP